MYRQGTPPTIVVGMELVKPLGETAQKFSEKLNIDVSYDPAVPSQA